MEIAIAVVAIVVVSIAPSASGAAAFPKSLPRNLYCGVCNALISEIASGIAATTETHMVQTRWRIDEKKRIPYARSEARLIEILEDVVPDVWSQYAVAAHTTPSGKKQFYLKRFNRKPGDKESGGIGNVEISGKKSDQMKSIFDWIMEEHMESVIKLYSTGAATAPASDALIPNQLCVNTLKGINTASPHHCITATTTTTPPPLCLVSSLFVV